MAATTLALGRSYYAWLAKVSSEAPYLSESFPKVFSTNPDLLRRVSRQTHKVLEGTQYESRSKYWFDLFENFDDYESLMRVEEGVIETALSLLTKVFTNPVQMSDNVLRKKLHSVVTSLSRTLWEIQERGGKKLFDKDKENWLRRLGKKSFEHTAEEVASSVELGKRGVDEIDIKSTNFLKVLLIGLVGSIPGTGLFFRNIIAMSVEVLEFILGFFLWLGEKVYGVVFRETLVKDGAKANAA